MRSFRHCCICSWPHRLICMCCYDVGVINYIRWRCAFPTQKQLCLYRGLPPKYQQFMSVSVVLCVVLLTALLVAAWFCSAALMHFGHSSFDLVIVCHGSSDSRDTLKSNISSKSVQTEKHLSSCDPFKITSKCGLAMICKNCITLVHYKAKHITNFAPFVLTKNNI